MGSTAKQRAVLPTERRPRTTHAPGPATDEQLQQYLQQRIGLTAGGARQLVALNNLTSRSDRQRLREHFRQFAS